MRVERLHVNCILGTLYNGRPYLKYNAMTERFDFLYVESGFESSFSRETSTEKRADKLAPLRKAGIAEASASSGGAAGAVPAAKTKPDKVTPQKLPGGTTPSSVPPAKTQKNGGGNARQAEVPAGGEKKTYDLSTAVKLKVRFLSETAECTTLIGMIEAEETWSWARGP